MGGAVDISLESLILYHGSNVEVINPKILRGRFTKDFGYGFYCTINDRRMVRLYCKL